MLVGGTLLALVVIIGSYQNLRGHSFNVVTQKTAPMGYGGGGMDMMVSESAALFAPAPDMLYRAGGSALEDLDGNLIEPSIIKTGSLSLRVDNAESAMNEARGIVSTKNGVVESSSLNDRGSGPRTAWMTVRVPADKFDETIQELKKIAILTLNESTNAQDVTAQVIDLEADLRNARAEEASYLAILERSGDVKDILAVTQQLSAVRQRIERLEGRMRLMQNQTDLSTISLTLTEATQVELPERTWRPGEVWRDALQDLVISLQGLVDLLIRAVVVLVGFLLPIGLIVWLLVWLGMKIWKKLF